MLLFYNEITIKSFTLNQPSNLEQIQLRFCFSDEKNNSCETGTFFWVFHFIRFKLVVSITLIYFTKINLKKTIKNALYFTTKALLVCKIFVFYLYFFFFFLISLLAIWYIGHTCKCLVKFN